MFCFGFRYSNFGFITKHAELNFYKKKVKYELIKESKSANSLAEKLIKTELFVFDTETDGLNQFQLKLAGVSFSTKPNEGFFIPINPFEQAEGLFANNLPDRLHVNDFVKLFKPVLENKKITRETDYSFEIKYKIYTPSQAIYTTLSMSLNSGVSVYSLSFKIIILSSLLSKAICSNPSINLLLSTLIKNL